MSRKHTSPAVALAALLTGLSCETLSSPLANVRLYLTDTPAEQIESAVVWISRAYLVPAGENEEFVTLTDEPQEYDLLTLQNGVTALLGEATIPEDDYEQLRLVVDSARLTLVEGATFADGERSRLLFVPSGMQTGIKVNFGGPLTISGGTDIVVDFDVSRNFKFLGPPPGPFDVLFTPLLEGTITEG
jgi:hypothetical protein